MGETPAREDGTVTRSAEYVGSFPVDDCCLDDQMQQLHMQLKSLTNSKRRRSVSLKFSVKGVKVYNEDETTLLMAHALRRVSLSIARPSDAQFAFVAHNPGSPDAQLYCHLFKARHARAAQFLNLLLCRCFQLFYLDKHPEDAQVDSSMRKPTCAPSLLNHGFPLSVSALVSFRRAPNQGLLLPEPKVPPHPSTDVISGPEDVFPISPTLVRKKAMRDKVLRSGAYRSFTCTPLKQRHLQDRLNAPQGKGPDSVPACRVRAPSLAETEEALAHAVWSWTGISSDSSSSLLAEDVLGSYLLCPHPEKPNVGSLLIRFPSGLVTLAVKTCKGKCFLEKCHIKFESLAALIEHYTEFRGELQCSLSCARVNHCYEWDETMNRDQRLHLPQRSKQNPKNQCWV
ncbi:SH2 domain-containing protein 5 isoform X1 [Electrophorus electricus]|uniref:PID domain-containing protein n=2 Tax=Electrophorus electricus TaxID=8005 RepID=A0A4W4FPK8_ELEEL|nr:SH2 domain-containing protein 5 isoform X1 [Electrophorus electricus]XP_026880025.2 SH2 domain-containing protein 5 isoform X1 [Electrophorus electricus]XP_026880033.2 SH2 domain-containing protein 5 isoform X1 [Electrophorus electricus]XP_026880041.2 SH2 domain-containing protein 5 isoform X1 [Electrophorus electricus]